MTERYLDAQVSVLGSVLIDDSVVGKVIHRTREEDFTGSYRTVYKAIKSVFLTGKPVDLTTISARLGPDYDKLLLQLMELTPTAANVDVYIDLALEEAQVERGNAELAAVQAFRTVDDIRALQSKLNRIICDRPSVRIVSMAQGLQDFYVRQQSKPEFMTWGIDKLDNTLMAERGGDFLVIGGYPSAGKTALSVQFAWAQAKTLKVGYFSLETKPDKLIDRTVSMVSGIDFGRIKRRQLGQDDWIVCKKNAGEITDRNLHVIQASGLSVADIQALSLSEQYDIIYIDYLQLIRPEDSRRSEYEQVTQISKDLHTMAQTTGITVVALSQLSRPKNDRNQEKSPGLHSLRQSGQIEQDADGVMLLYKEQPNDPVSRRCLKIAKNKEGEAGGILMLDFDGKKQRFTVAENTANAAREFTQRGKQVKQANHIKQTSMFQELDAHDPDNPFEEAKPHDK